MSVIASETKQSHLSVMRLPRTLWVLAMTTKSNGKVVNVYFKVFSEYLDSPKEVTRMAPGKIRFKSIQ